MLERGNQHRRGALGGAGRRTCVLFSLAGAQAHAHVHAGAPPASVPDCERQEGQRQPQPHSRSDPLTAEARLRHRGVGEHHSGVSTDLQRDTKGRGVGAVRRALGGGGIGIPGGVARLRCHHPLVGTGVPEIRMKGPGVAADQHRVAAGPRHAHPVHVGRRPRRGQEVRHDDGVLRPGAVCPAPGIHQRPPRRGQELQAAGVQAGPGGSQAQERVRQSDQPVVCLSLCAVASPRGWEIKAAVLQILLALEQHRGATTRAQHCQSQRRRLQRLHPGDAGGQLPGHKAPMFLGRKVMTLGVRHVAAATLFDHGFPKFTSVLVGDGLEEHVVEGFVPLGVEAKATILSADG